MFIKTVEVFSDTAAMNVSWTLPSDDRDGSDLRVFVRFTPVEEWHFNDPDCSPNQNQVRCSL